MAESVARNPENETMCRRACALTRAFAIGLALLVAACVSAPPSPAPSAFRSHEDDARVVLSSGYASIFDKYIEKVDFGTVVIDSLRGLAAIDPALTVKRNGGRVTLLRNGRLVTKAEMPKSLDPDIWSDFAIRLTDDAAAVSTDIRHADPETIYQAMFDGALSELDVYSRYAGASEAARNRADRDGFGGVGIRLKLRQGVPVVAVVLAGSPAKAAGLVVGDEIIAIGGASITGQSIDRITARLHGDVRSTVGLEVRHADNRIELVRLKRTHIVPPTVKARQVKDILLIRISSFNQGTAQGVADLLGPQLADEHVAGIVLDLRGNPGGLLSQAVEVADAFLDRGVILNTRGRHPDSVQHYEASGRDFSNGLPVVVLIDGRSASASEIVAVALQDTLRAVIVGSSSYGKGTVQTVIRLPNDGELTLTWSRFMAPSGYALHGLGVFPELCASEITSDDRAGIAAILKHQPELTAILRSWRHTARDNVAGRRKLRALCPPTRRIQKADVDIAQVLIHDARLYKGALRIAALASNDSTAQASP